MRLRAGVVPTALGVVAACVLAMVARSGRAVDTPLAPYEYVVNGNEVAVYNLGTLSAKPALTFVLPLRQAPQGVAADAASGTLYVSFGGEGAPPDPGRFSPTSF